MKGSGGFLMIGKTLRQLLNADIRGNVNYRLLDKCYRFVDVCWRMDNFDAFHQFINGIKNKVLDSLEIYWPTTSFHSIVDDKIY